MGVLTKKSDVDAQWRRYGAAQKAALDAEGVFERSCNEGHPDAECQEAWRRVGLAVATSEAEWKAYQAIAPAKMRTK